MQGGQSRKGCGEGLEMGWEVNRGQIAKGIQCPIGKLALLVQPGTLERSLEKKRDNTGNTDGICHFVNSVELVLIS